jgi:predicted transglutaminase-like cysteine proteinase
MRRRLSGLAALAAVLCVCAAAGAAELRGQAHAPFVTAGKTSIPVGARAFCNTWPDECRPVDAPAGPIALTDGLWAELVEVNDAWNRDIVPVTDQDFYAVSELWAYPEGYGDCEDYVLAKRRDLVARGWPSSALLIALVRQRSGDAHAVLVAVTDAGDLVLDNLVANIVDWDRTDYKFVKIQTPATLSQWVDVEDDRQLWADAGQ